ncbi:unnamed protein product [Medioppia subpectinata]|uniref:Uncharacterized protein n=1 Tax=Medioppia subpectinata TaxID=1979941 RepID=A0A7R9KXD3_9ACAR|nr:unnamed protein product [Medioppia subpectinata]CAG2110489.1 unnamed protein product [Medioppia subpectinata]
MTGRNFCADTCESCKAFFRRTALKTTVLHCASNGLCNINVQTRKLCQKCRLQKCLTIGMQIELIRSETQNEYRKQIYRDKQKKKLLDKKLNTCNDLSDTDSNLSKPDSIGIDSNNSNDSNEIDEWIDSIDDKELSEQINQIKRCLTGETEAMKQIRQKSAAMAIVPIVKTIVDYCGINQLESSRITELSDACQVFNCQLSDNRVTTKGYLDMMIVTNRLFEIQIQNVITYTKRLRGFQKFCADDQLALVKHGFNDMIFLRGLSYYDPDTREFNYYIDENSTLSISLGAFSEQRPNTHEMLLILLSKLLPEWDHDPILMDLLTAIVLLNPKRPNLSHRTSIKLEQQLLEQQLYIYLLQRYLLLKCGSESESKPRLQALMNSLTDLSITAETHKRYELSEVAENHTLIQYYGPLFREIYDI